MNTIGSDLALAEKFRAELAARRQEGGAGACAALYRGGQLVAGCAVGVCGDGVTPAQTEDLYQIGSISKVYCAAALRRLESQGKVSLDAPVVRYLPDFRMRDGRYRDITLRMLLNHTSGLPGTNPRNMITPGAPGLDRRRANHLYWQRSKLKAAPGEYGVYCNEGFELAAEVVETVSGMDYMEFLRRELLQPLGLTSFSLAETPSCAAHPMHMRAQQEEYVIAKGAGALRCTVADNARFGAAFLHPGVLTQAELDDMAAPARASFLPKDEMAPWYGLGWDSVEQERMPLDLGPHTLSKGGATLQFTSFLIVSPRYDLSIALSATYDCGFLAGSELYRLLAIASDHLGLDIPRRDIRPAPHRASVEPSFARRYGGTYYSTYGILRVSFEGDTLHIQKDEGAEDVETPPLTTAVYNGAVFAYGEGERVEFDTQNGVDYIYATNYNMGVPLFPMGQKVSRPYPLTPAWRARVGRTYLTANLTERDLRLDGPFIARVAEEDGVLSFFITNHTTVSAVACGADDTDTLLRAPGWGAMNLWTPYITHEPSGEVLRLWDYDLPDTGSLPQLATGSVCAAPERNGAYRLRGGDVLTSPLPEGVAAAVVSPQGTLTQMVRGGETMRPTRGGYLLFVCEGGARTFSVTVSNPHHPTEGEPL